MSTLRSGSVRLLVALAVVLAAIGPPMAAAAHPLDEYLQAAYLTLGRDGVALELDLSPGLLVAPDVIALLDADRDRTISEAEGQAYARVVLDRVSLEVDGQRYALAPTSVALPPMLNLSSGLGLLRIEVSATGPRALAAGAHRAVLENDHAPVKSAYQAAVVLGDGGGVNVAHQSRDETQRTLTVEYSTVAAPGSSASPASAPGVANGPAPEVQRWLLDVVRGSAASPWLLGLALAASALLGALHALTPGHSKALIAAYLVGSRGTARQAVLLGGTVTFTHTASVMALGLLVLLAGRLVVPELLVPALEAGSGLLVLVLGIRLVWARWHAVRHDHHDHHGHTHGDDHAHHDHGAGRTAGLLAMGVSGGLVPCPEALGILLVAVGLHRVVFGLGLIAAFSLELAAVPVAIGVPLVRARPLVERVGGRGRVFQRILPLGSALVVTALGAAMSVSGALALAG